MNGVLVDVLYYIFIAFVSYFIGTVNFSKIIAWYFRHKDITKVGSGNPGTMNMLRSFGLGLALSTFIAEVVKAGLTCFIFQLLFPQYPIVYFFSGLFVLLGYIFPVWSKFKGGKGLPALPVSSYFQNFGMSPLAGLRFVSSFSFSSTMAV